MPVTWTGSATFGGTFNIPIFDPTIFTDQTLHISIDVLTFPSGKAPNHPGFNEGVLLAAGAVALSASPGGGGETMVGVIGGTEFSLIGSFDAGGGGTGFMGKLLTSTSPPYNVNDGGIFRYKGQFVMNMPDPPVTLPATLPLTISGVVVGLIWDRGPTETRDTAWYFAFDADNGFADTTQDTKSGNFKDATLDSLSVPPTGTFHTEFQDIFAQLGGVSTSSAAEPDWTGAPNWSNLIGRTNGKAYASLGQYTGPLDGGIHPFSVSLTDNPPDLSGAFTKVIGGPLTQVFIPPGATRRSWATVIA